MRTWFGQRTVVAGGPDGLGAYKEGRADERAVTAHDADAVRVDRGAVNDAYDRGRREERLRHRSSPFLMIVTALLVIIALGVLILTVRTGSFTNAGAVIDSLIQPPVLRAEDKAGSALQNAGQNLKDRAGSSNSSQPASSSQP
jgi:hypothetical protein